MKAFVIGAGGVGSWLVPSLIRLIGSRNICVVDGDTLEEKNLDRQLYTQQHIGVNKALALSRLYGCDCRQNYFSMGRFTIQREDILIACVDNHPARRAALNECDARGCSALFAANETHSAEAYFYKPQWRGTPLDPRVYFPELLTGNDGDPLAEAIGCTGEAQEQNRQLVSANFLAAGLVQHLFVLWCLEAPHLDRDTLPFLPFRLVANMTKMESFRVKDALSERTENDRNQNAGGTVTSVAAAEEVPA